MIIRKLAFAAALALAALPAAADGIAGKWNASVATEQGPFALVFEFAEAGGKLTGTLQNDFIGSIPIQEGTVKGNDVAFKLTIAMDGLPEPLKISYTGTVKGDELSLTSKFEGAPPGGGPAEQQLTATRAK
ncbi:MAG TPA: hypothetical protein VFO94_15930 [Gammaproteobacteria bacterium]|nr:hypothetical protein [Gammaproteobacteria bacterium]